MDAYSSLLALSMAALACAATARLAVTLVGPRDASARRLRAAVAGCSAIGLLLAIGASAVHAIRGHGASAAAPLGPLGFLLAHPAVPAVLLACVALGWSVRRRGSR